MDIEAVAFDLDGTIAKTTVTFTPFRKRIGCEKGDILTFISQFDYGTQQKMYSILDEYEQCILEDCVLNDGFLDIMEYLKEKDIATGIVTRSSRKHAKDVINKLNIPITTVIGREDAPPKPSGEPLILLSQTLKKPREKMICVGDYLWDILAGKNAHVKTVLLINNSSHQYCQYCHLSDYIIHNLYELRALIEQ